jgi:hypothetical protein
MSEVEFSRFKDLGEMNQRRACQYGGLVALEIS